jgi:hypothetical protein
MSILKTRVVYHDLEKSSLLNKNITDSDEIHVDLSDVGAITQSEDEDECIVFIHGRDLTIKTPYYEALAKWRKSKEEDNG